MTVLNIENFFFKSFLANISQMMFVEHSFSQIPKLINLKNLLKYKKYKMQKKTKWEPLPAIMVLL